MGVFGGEANTNVKKLQKTHKKKIKNKFKKI